MLLIYIISILLLLSSRTSLAESIVYLTSDTPSPITFASSDTYTVITTTKTIYVQANLTLASVTVSILYEIKFINLNFTSLY